MNTTPTRIAIFALPQLFDSSLALTLDILKTAQTVYQHQSSSPLPCEVELYTWDGQSVETAAGFKASAKGSFHDAVSSHVIIIPGLGLWNLPDLDAMLRTDAAFAAIDALKRTHTQGALLAASCSSVFLLAASGVLDKQDATTSWWLARVFQTRFPNVRLHPERVLVQGPRTLCAGAAMAQADLMIALVAHLWSAALAQWTARFLLIDKRELQPQYLFSGLEAERHPDVAQAATWIRTHMAEAFTVSDLARALAMSPRTLARRLEDGTGQSPVRFIRNLRAQHAIHLLETTPLGFDTITVQVGYTNASSLRRLLKKHTGLTPSQLRARKR